MSELFQLLQSSPLAFISLCTVLGLMVGSFLNVEIHRLPKMLEREWKLQCAELKDQITGSRGTGDSELVGNSFDARRLAPDIYNLVVPR